MPKFLEDKLKREYPNNPHAVYGTMNKVGAMHGNKETAKGRAMERKHEMKKNAAGNHAGNKGKKHIEGHRGNDHPHGNDHLKRHTFSNIGHKGHSEKMSEC